MPESPLVYLLQYPVAKIVKVEPYYSIYLSSGLVTDLTKYIPEKHLAIITDNNVGALYGEKLSKSLESTKQIKLYTVAAGEESKSLETFGKLLRKMVRDGFDRKGAVLALGGGVVGDLAGFIAASYYRGIAFYQCPTSLLAMVDASIGGKTGVNVPEGKNLVGAFWQPRRVFIDVEVLKTLPEQEFKYGAVELFKHGLLADESIITDVSSAEFHPAGDSDFLTDLITRAAKVKVAIVSQDEREAGVRAYLNLGHTLAHALESYTKHGISHGEAVAYGLIFAAKLSALYGFADETGRVLDFWHWVGPRPLAIRNFIELSPYISRDKKHHSGKQNWVLLEALGKPTIVNNISSSQLESAWQYLIKVTQ